MLAPVLLDNRRTYLNLLKKVKIILLEQGLIGIILNFKVFSFANRHIYTNFNYFHFVSGFFCTCFEILVDVYFLPVSFARTKKGWF